MSYATCSAQRKMAKVTNTQAWIVVIEWGVVALAAAKYLLR